MDFSLQKCVLPFWNENISVYLEKVTMVSCCKQILYSRASKIGKINKSVSAQMSLNINCFLQDTSSSTQRVDKAHCESEPQNPTA